jgi:hypothetical protein
MSKIIQNYIKIKKDALGGKIISTLEKLEIKY